MTKVLVYTVGYECRSGFIPSEQDFDHRIAILFEKHHILSWDENFSKAQERGDRELKRSQVSLKLRAALDDAFEAISDVTQAPELCIDISSMTRSLMAEVITISHQLLLEKKAAIKLLYAPAKYTKAPDSSPPFFDFNPVKGMEGWTAFPERPLSLVVGLGYEVNLAVGAIEYLDPSGLWAFVPNGKDKRFRKDVRKANEVIWPMLEASHALEYDVSDTHRTYAELRGLTEALLRRSRVVLVPGGPKILSALAMIVKFELGDEVSVWRTSWHELVEFKDVEPSKEIVEFYYPRVRSSNYLEISSK